MSDANVHARLDPQRHTLAAELCYRRRGTSLTVEPDGLSSFAIPGA